MAKIHDMHRTVIDCIEITYFYKREKNDINGNSRYRVYIMDYDAPAVHELLLKCYESQIKEYVSMFIEKGTKQCI